ncbi:hypothetical protein [Haloparvum sedimenti]|uniref:hypothetical protein n=1 Tax=Haloparvum sedimenti TaxID=1678448 RepID=UPI00071E6D64|nr:hypothetical protein [Haloparvum sedimenti]
MTDESADDEDAPTPEEDPTDTPNEGGEGEDDRPPIEEDERADVDLSEITEEIQAEEGGESPTESPDADTDGDTQAEGSNEGDEEGGETPPKGAHTWGDQYVATLSMVLPEIAEEMSGEDCEMEPADIEDLATQRPVCLDEQVDRLAAEMGGTEDLPPGQAVVLSTGLLVGTVLLKEGGVAGDLAGRVQEAGA